MRVLLASAALALAGIAHAEPAPPDDATIPVAATAAPAVTAITAAVESLCQQVTARITQVTLSACRGASLQAAASTSVEGRALLQRDFHPMMRREKAPRVLLIGAIHGDELSAGAVVFQWIEQLKNDRFQRFDWRVLPVANPDGVMGKPSHRTNAHKVDLNRNFPTPDWNDRAQSYWKQKTNSDPRRYPGPSAGSEPETRWIMEQIAQFKPDAIVSVHAPYNVLDFDGPQDPPKKLGYLLLEPLGVYPGSLGNYAGLHLKLPVITLELPQATQPPSALQSQRIWADLLGWLDRHLPASRN